MTNVSTVGTLEVKLCMCLVLIVYQKQKDDNTGGKMKEHRQPLTPLQQRVYELNMGGMKQDDIAEEMSMTQQGISRVQSALRKKGYPVNKYYKPQKILKVKKPVQYPKMLGQINKKEVLIRVSKAIDDLNVLYEGLNKVRTELIMLEADIVLKEA